ncbi:MAG: class B sortase [Lachnospiraceae bacterium]|nr:class B sortase [Robinsoniella sp.]MDY3765585.1 class B sortase [Lachnospiraceae bacterium]
MAKNKKKGKVTVGSVIRSVVLVAALCVFCYSGYQLITIYLEYKQGTDEYKDLEQYVDVANNTSVAADTEKQTVKDTEEEIDMDETSTDEFGTVIIGDIIDSDEEEAQAVMHDPETTQIGENTTQPMTEQTTDPTTETEKETAVITEDENGNVKILGKIAKVKKRVDFEELQKINPEIIGWLYVEAIDSINYPITQTEDNAYYLSHTFKKTDNIAGSIFLDCDTKPNFTETNSVIYGHNMKNGSMFGKLNLFYKEETYEESKYFWIYTPDLYYKYEIFSCVEVGAISKTYQRQFESDRDFEDYLETMKENSIIKTDTKVTASDKIVTLSTCTASSDVRFVVQGKLVRAYQVVDPDKVKTTSTETEK